MDKNNDILIDGTDERIDAFLRGTMNPEEESAFKQEIRQNPELRSRTIATTLLIKELRDRNTAREKAIINEDLAKSNVRPILWWACSVAAVFAILFSIYKDYRYRMLDTAVSPYYMEYDMSDISRGDADSVAIFHLYNLFAKIQETRKMSNIIEELEPIYRSLDDDFTYHPYANDIAWNLVLAYVKDDQIDKAITILEELKKENPDTPIYNKADELVKKLSEL